MTETHFERVQRIMWQQNVPEYIAERVVNTEDAIQARKNGRIAA